MTLRTAPHDLVRAVVAEDHRPVAGVDIVKERHDGKDAAYAVAFEDRDGALRRGVIAMTQGSGDRPARSWAVLESQATTTYG